MPVHIKNKSLSITGGKVNTPKGPRSIISLPSFISLNKKDLLKMTRELPKFVVNYFNGECLQLLRVLDQVQISNDLEEFEKNDVLIKLVESLIHQRRYGWAQEIFKKLPLAVREF